VTDWTPPPGWEPVDWPPPGWELVKGGGIRPATPPRLRPVPERTRHLEYLELPELLARADRAPSTFLIDELWPADAYGVIGAEDKAGKTWAICDLAVSIATGTPWLGRFACEQGPVQILFGEGGPRGLHRRLDAVCRERGLAIGQLDGRLRVALAVPRLTNAVHLQEIADELADHPARAVLLDPFYLAAPAGKGADLYAMGEALGAIQAVSQDAGAALVTSVHWNKTGEGTGARRFSGVGPGAWGRVLGSAGVEQRHTDADGASIVTLRWEFSGGEIADTAFRMRRRVWAADRHDLRSPLTYEVEVTDEGVPIVAGLEGLSPAARRVLTALGTEPTTVREIGDVLARDGQGPPLKPRTIQRGLQALADAGLADGEKGDGVTAPARWWRL
jgi:hypothetical protein